MKTRLITGLCVLLIAVSNGSAMLTDVFFEDLSEQDPLFGPPVVHELGTLPLFPFEEVIETWEEETTLTACPDFPGDDPAIPNFIVYMTNHTGQTWTDVWYVADGIDPFVPAETALTNYDGLVNGALAFKIDTVGINRNLVFEDLIPDGIFQPGETWGFIIQDYQNILNLPASRMGSLGVPSIGEAPFPPANRSSGSIIAIPEPATLALLAVGGLLLRRRK